MEEIGLKFALLEINKVCKIGKPILQNILFFQTVFKTV